MAIVINDKEYVIRNIKTRDIPKVSRILKKMDIDKFDVMNMVNSLVGKDINAAQKAAGIEAMLYLLTRLGNAENDFYEFFSSLTEGKMSPDEFADLDIEDLVEFMKALKEQKGIMNFLRLLSKSMQ
ncbi:hypothetical protein J2S74_002312 [Evansella vedderi]|uniref:Uncharacterized protein n=1 Tax=Evansella vedderi TaxID=38282 RepID=A0ABT9ZVF4_9BACI|nr:hypothetical protein [Evansella vedderi]MDQ0254930.1 hypothetical protein [Evansella vedderi]